ncbi:hypothetical protein ZWY2020_001131 [Hordeum vulgare]|nr:hypothetical protein ZWY2020_001131 [Hordeum vulgare]
MSKKSSQDVEEGSSGEDSDAETPKTKKKPAKHGRKKATIDASNGHAKEGQSDTEDVSPEEPKIVKKRGRKKEALFSQDTGEVDKLTPLVCCFGPAKYSFIPSGRPTNRLVDREIHNKMKDMFWSPDEFVRAPGGTSSNVALALAALGGQVVFMGKLGDDEYGQSMLYHLNMNGVQTRAVSLDPSAPTAMPLMKVTSRGSLNIRCVKSCAVDCFQQSDINPDVLKEDKRRHGRGTVSKKRTHICGFLSYAYWLRIWDIIIFFRCNARAFLLSPLIIKRAALLSSVVGHFVEKPSQFQVINPQSNFKSERTVFCHFAQRPSHYWKLLNEQRDMHTRIRCKVENRSKWGMDQENEGDALGDGERGLLPEGRSG